MNIKSIAGFLSILLVTAFIEGHEQIDGPQQINQAPRHKYAHLSTEERKNKMLELFSEFVDKSKAKDKGFNYYANEFEAVCNDNGDLWKSLGNFCTTVKTIKKPTDAPQLKKAFSSIEDNNIKKSIENIAQKHNQLKLFLAFTYRLHPSRNRA